MSSDHRTGEAWAPSKGDRVRLTKQIACTAPVGSEGEVTIVWGASTSNGISRPAQFCVDCDGYPPFVTDASNLAPVHRPSEASPQPASDYDAGLATAERIVRSLAKHNADRSKGPQDIRGLIAGALYDAADHVGSAVFTHPQQRPNEARAFTKGQHVFVRAVVDHVGDEISTVMMARVPGQRAAERVWVSNDDLEPLPAQRTEPAVHPAGESFWFARTEDGFRAFQTEEEAHAFRRGFTPMQQTRMAVTGPYVLAAQRGESPVLEHPEARAIRTMAAQLENLGAEPCSECGYSLNEIRDYVHELLELRKIAEAARAVDRSRFEGLDPFYKTLGALSDALAALPVRGEEPKR